MLQLHSNHQGWLHVLNDGFHVDSEGWSGVKRVLLPPTHPLYPWYSACGCSLMISLDTSAHEELGFTPDQAGVDAVLANVAPWDCIYPEDRKAMIADMEHRTVRKGQLIQIEDDSYCPLYIILTGTVDMFQPVGTMTDPVAAPANVLASRPVYFEISLVVCLPLT